ncbi:MAG: MBL fold metallo-hydrolase [Sheuella sp.]|nr:MBL fold metallo-hydrolase [Sheuella sp.]
MSDPLVTLLPDVVIEPLIARWYAWSHLISPATAALNTTYQHIPLLQSFVASPDVHAVACQTPSLRGGPFVDLPNSEVGAVQSLIKDTQLNQASLIAFGESLRDAFRFILKNADGFSLEKHYQSLPDPVKGYVELFYTLGGFPDLRVIEPMLYRSDLNRSPHQTAMVYRAKGDQRSFAFSTPRMPRADAFELNAPFASDIYDFLAQLRFKPQPWSVVLERLQVKAQDIELVRSLVTDTQSPVTVHQHHPGQTRWRYFGHACVLVESAHGKSVLVDPLIAYETDPALKRFVLSDLPESIDYVVLTHNHADHVLIETLLALRYRIDTIVVPASGGGLADPSLKLMLESIGFKKVVELGPLGSIEVADLKLTALPFLGEHGDLDIRSKAAWHVQAGQHSLLFAADSNNLEPRMYDMLRAMFGRIDTLFIGMECLGAPFSWTYGPLLPVAVDRKKDQSRRLNGSDFQRGLEVVKSLGCQSVYVYAMGAEPWLQFITSIDPDPNTAPVVNAKQLVEQCQAMGLISERLYGHAEVVL